MAESVSYSISEAAEILNLSSKTIRRYIKSGKLPSTKVPTKFGEEYRITEIPETLKQEADEQEENSNQVNLVASREDPAPLDTQQLYQENMRLAAQLGAASERIRQLEEQLKNQASELQAARQPPALPEGQTRLVQALEDNIRLLQAEARRPWWKKLFGLK